MTISSTVRKAGPFTGTGLVSTYPFTFKVFQASDVLVQQTDTAGNITTLALTSAYTVTLNADQNGNPGGNVVLNSALPSGYALVIGSQVPQTQGTLITNNGGFYPTVITDALDRLTILVQQQQQTVNNTLQLPFAISGVSTTLPTPAANKLIGWNAGANALQNMDPGVLATIVAYGTANSDIFTGDGSTKAFTLSGNPGAQANLDIDIGGVTQTAGIDFTWSGGQTVTFSVAPPSGTRVHARYMQALPQGTTDSAASTYTQGGTGSVSRTVSAKLQESVSVLDFGADPTGLVDSTVAFNAAITTGKKVLVPAGTYIVNNISVVSNMDIEGQGECGSSKTTLLVSTNNASAFLANTTSGDVLNIRIANMVVSTTSTAVTGTNFYTQTSNANYSAYVQFHGIDSYLNLAVAYNGFFIFTEWRNCRDGYNGNASASGHYAISSIPAAWGQAKQTNLNQLYKCQLFNATSGSPAVVDIAYGANWYFNQVDFEGPNCQAVRARGIYSGRVQNCWFEHVTAAQMITLDISTAPNQQGCAPWVIDGCYVNMNSTTTSFIFGGAACSYTITNNAFATIGTGVVLSSSGYNGLAGQSVNSTLSGAGASGFLTQYTVPQANQNVLPIGPSGLGAANLTLNGFTAKLDVASALGLSGNAVQLTMSGSGNAAYYTIPAKLLTFLKGKYVTLVLCGYSGTATTADSGYAAIWDSVGVPAYANSSAANPSIDVSNTSLQVSAVTWQVSASATSLNVGFIVGGANATKTFIIETMALYIGSVNPTAAPLH